MDIVFVIDRFPAEPGGVKKIVVELADRLSVRHRVLVAVPEGGPRHRTLDRRATTDSRGARWVLLYHRPGIGNRLLSAPARYVQLPIARRYGHGHAGLPAALLYGRVVGKSLAAALPRRPDVVHAFTADTTGHLALGLGRATGATVVCTGSPHPGQYGDGPIDSYFYRRADSIVAISKPDRDVYLGLGVASDRIAVIPPPSEDLGVSGREQARQRLGIRGPLVLFAGVRRDYKGADILYAAAPSIGAHVEGTTIAFVGPGAAMAPMAGVTIVDAGQVDRAMMNDWIRAADVVTLPSLHEACSIVVLEAWSAGVPVVVSDIPSLSFQITASGGGVAVPRRPARVAEAIVELLQDAERRAQLGRCGRAYWEAHCPIDGIVRAHEELYARLTGGHRRSSKR